MSRVKPGTEIMLGRDRVTVWGYNEGLDCYRISYLGPSWWAARYLVESAPLAKKKSKLQPFGSNLRGT